METASWKQKQPKQATVTFHLLLRIFLIFNNNLTDMDKSTLKATSDTDIEVISLSDDEIISIPSSSDSEDILDRIQSRDSVRVVRSVDSFSDQSDDWEDAKPEIEHPQPIEQSTNLIRQQIDQKLQSSCLEILRTFRNSLDANRDVLIGMLDQGTDEVKNVQCDLIALATGLSAGLNQQTNNNSS